MRWSFQIGRVFGIPIRLHVTFFLLLFVFVLGFRGGMVQIHLDGLALVVLLFGSVLIHELCHSLVAMRKGVPVSSITLLPIGGMAEMAAMPERPADEVKIALAGPLASFVVACFVFLLGGSLGYANEVLTLPIGGSGHAGLPVERLSLAGALFSRLFWGNIVLGTLNLVPAFPMDGGRVLRGALASRVGLLQATRWAVTSGQAFAVFLYLLGWMYPSLRGLILLAVFIYIGAEGEEEEVEFRTDIADVPARDAMLTRFDTLAPEMSITDSLDVLRHSQQEVFPVLADGRLSGFVSKNDVLNGLRELPPEAVIGEVMNTDFVSCSPDTPMGEVFRNLERHNNEMVPVIESGKLVGLISFDQIGRYHTIASRQRTEPT